MKAEGLTDQGYISGKTIHDYLHSYADHFDLLRRTRFSTWVQNVERTDGTKWKVFVTDPSGGDSIICDKLIIANGPASKPRLPDFALNTTFKNPIIHSRDLGTYIDRLQSPDVKRVLILGAAKSAYDAAYAAMELGKQVDWVIRPTGGGPLTMFPANFFGINAIAIASTRFYGKFSPSNYVTSGLWYKLLQRSWLGQQMTKSFWAVTSAMNSYYAGYSNSANSEQLRPRPNNAFWCNGGLGCASLPKFWELLHSGGARLHSDEIVKMEGTEVLLKSGNRLETDFAILCTGWDDDVSLFSPEEMADLGLPSFSRESAPLSPTDELADARINAAFPLLAEGGEKVDKRKQRAWNLYRRVVPSELVKRGDTSLVFLGQIHTLSTMMLGGVQALWAVEYMRGGVEIPDDETVDTEVAEFNAWTRKRYLHSGLKVPYAIYDFMPYIDVMCRDLGISAQRKGMLRDLVTPYGPRDYKDIIKERKGVVVRKQKDA